jgi:transposase-like protein
MRKRKHPKAEIAVKLAQADDLAAQGKLQSEIARALGVSVMTLHRWRKLPIEWFEPNRSDAANTDCRASARKFTAAAVGDRSAHRKDENRRGISGRALGEGWASHEASCQSRLVPFGSGTAFLHLFQTTAGGLPAARLRLFAKFVQRHHARIIAPAL